MITLTLYDHIQELRALFDSLYWGTCPGSEQEGPARARSAPTSDGAARVGGACLPTWASPGMGVRGRGRAGCG